MELINGDSDGDNDGDDDGDDDDGSRGGGGRGLFEKSLFCESFGLRTNSGMVRLYSR